MIEVPSILFIPLIMLAVYGLLELLYSLHWRLLKP